MSDNRVDSFWMSQSLVARLWSGLTAWSTCAKVKSLGRVGAHERRDHPRPASSEVYSDRTLHHAWRPRGCRSAKACRRAERRIFSLSYDSTDAAVGVRHRAQTELQTSVDVPEIRAVEYIIDLPTQLHLALLTNLKVLEDRKIVVEDRRHAHRISRHIANVTQARRIGETTDINHVLHSCRVVSTHSFHWIAKNL